MKINGIKVLPVTLVDGTQGFIVPGTIPDYKWRVLHGKTLSGEEVNSPKLTLIDGTKDAAIESKGGYFGMTRAELEVLCVGGVQIFGHKVQAPGAAS